MFFINFRPPDDIPKQLYGDIGESRTALVAGSTVNTTGSASTIINLNIGPPPACAPPAPPKKRNMYTTNENDPQLSSS